MKPLNKTKCPSTVIHSPSDAFRPHATQTQGQAKGMCDVITGFNDCNRQEGCTGSTKAEFETTKFAIFKSHIKNMGLGLKCGRNSF